MVGARFLPAVLQSHDSEFDRSIRERTGRSWVVDAIVTLVSITFAIGIHLGDHAHFGDPVVIVDAVCAPLAVIALFWRRQWPFTVAVILALLSAVAPGTGLASAFGIYAVAAYSRPTIGVLGIGLSLVSVPIVALLWPDISNNDSGFWSTLAFGVIITLGVGAWGMFAGARRELMATLRDRATRAESEQQMRIAQARQQERTRIAREMHDVLAHRMSLLSVHAGALEFRPDAPPEDVARAAGVIRATAHEALEELRTVIGVLRVSDTTLGPDGAPAAAAEGAELAPEPPQPMLGDVPHLVEEWRAAGARIDLDLASQAAAVPPTIGRAAYRVVQEALTNAGKHAPTARVHVTVGGEPGGSLTVAVTNPLAVSTGGGGVATRAIPGTGIGLIGLRERIELVGGAFAAGVDQDTQRFVLEARLPWSAAA